MPTKRFLLGEAAKWCSIIAVPLALIPLPEPYRTWGFAAVTFAVSGVLLFLIGQYRGNRRAARQSSAPTVVLVGGPGNRTFGEEILKVPELQERPFIEFSHFVVGESNLSEVLDSVEGYILLPDFTPKNYPAEYAQLTAWARGRAVPIARFYPKDFKEISKLHDFEHLPWHTTQEVAWYGSEFLLTRAVERGRRVCRKLTDTRRLLWACVALVAVGLSWGYSVFTELSQAHAILKTPPTAQEELADVSRVYREAHKGSLTPAQKTAERTFLKTRAKVIADDISRISETSDPKRVYVYGLSTDGTKLHPVVSQGASGYDLDAVNSIAGCAFQQRLDMYWAGHEGQTQKIRGWRLSGEEVGEYRPEEERFRFGSGSCTFQKNFSREPKDQLICHPFGVDGSDRFVNVAGVVCVEADHSKLKLNVPWIRTVLEVRSDVLGMIDMSQLAMAAEE